MNNELNKNIAAAFGLPKYTKKAVITLEPGKLPVIELEMYLVDRYDNLLVEYSGFNAKKISEIQFKIRLEPYT